MAESKTDKSIAAHLEGFEKLMAKSIEADAQYVDSIVEAEHSLMEARLEDGSAAGSFIVDSASTPTTPSPAVSIGPSERESLIDDLQDSLKNLRPISNWMESVRVKSISAWQIAMHEKLRIAIAQIERAIWKMRDTGDVSFKFEPVEKRKKTKASKYDVEKTEAFIRGGKDDAQNQ